MKNIKTFIIGFLSCACLFLIVGAGIENEEAGRYSISTCTNDKGSWIAQTIFDTKTGEIVRREKSMNAEYKYFKKKK